MGYRQKAELQRGNWRGLFEHAFVPGFSFVFFGAEVAGEAFGFAGGGGDFGHFGGVFFHGGDEFFNLGIGVEIFGFAFPVVLGGVEFIHAGVDAFLDGGEQVGVVAGVFGFDLALFDFFAVVILVSGAGDDVGGAGLADDGGVFVAAFGEFSAALGGEEFIGGIGGGDGAAGSGETADEDELFGEGFGDAFGFVFGGGDEVDDLGGGFSAEFDADDAAAGLGAGAVGAHDDIAGEVAQVGVAGFFSDLGGDAAFAGKVGGGFHDSGVVGIVDIEDGVDGVFHFGAFADVVFEHDGVVFPSGVVAVADLADEIIAGDADVGEALGGLGGFFGGFGFFDVFLDFFDAVHGFGAAEDEAGGVADAGFLEIGGDGGGDGAGVKVGEFFLF